MIAYFFFDDFLLLDFFEDLDADFLAAIVLTTFHAVRDLPVALSWHYVPDFSGKLAHVEGVPPRGETGVDDLRHD